MHADWNTLYEELQHCEKCELCKERHTVVPGEGDPHAKLMFVGEGPGRDEDLSGRPFVGAAGQLLDKMLAAIDLQREDVYIANVVKCRPPQNRTPLEHEAEACLPYLRAQFALIRPSIIVCLARRQRGICTIRRYASRGIAANGSAKKAFGCSRPITRRHCCAT